VGGTNNEATGPAAFIGGGVLNTNRGRSAFVGGGDGNSIQTLADNNVIAGGFYNFVQSATDYGVIAGGSNNRLEEDADYSVVGGGWLNIVGTNAQHAFIGGGENNAIARQAHHSVVGGGFQNGAMTNGAAVLGGTANLARGLYSAVGGGIGNTASGYSGAVPGGTLNAATGTNSLAAGYRAKALHGGSFVWADRTEADFNSTAVNQFAVRAQNGVVIQATNTALDLRGGGTVRVSGAGLNSGTPVFIHRATAANIVNNWTVIDHPHCNNNPNAILIVTPNYNPGGVGGTYSNHSIGVYYTNNRWTIFNQSLAPIALNAAFNVLVVTP
jgi:hypothetical protein